MKDRRALIAIVVFVAFMGAVVWFRSSSGSNASTIEAAPTTTAAPAPGAAGSWEQGLARVTRIENELYRRPDAKRVGEMMDPSCSCADVARNRLTDLATKGHKVAGDNIVVQHSVLQRQFDPRRVQLVVSLKPGGFPTVDKSGKRVEASPSRQPPPFTYILVKGADDVWRIADRRSVESQQS